MAINIDEKNLDKFIIEGDRVLIKPKKPMNKTSSGLFLPPGVQKKENIQSGYILKNGAGHPIPGLGEESKVWKKEEGDKVKCQPLKASEGDLAIYLKSASHQ